MKRIDYIIAYILTALLLASCTEREDPMPNPDDGTIVYPSLRVGVTEMTMDPTSRALGPMSPDEEKYVKSIAVFEFDNEGQHTYGPATFHFIDFLKGTVDGKTNVGNVDSTEYGIVEADLEGLAFVKYTGSKSRICLVANVPLDSVKKFYKELTKTGQTEGIITFDQFTQWALPFDYKKQPTSDVYNDSTIGHLERMYMFGYYQGPIDPATTGNLPIDLGRLASRVDITIVNQTGSDITKRLGYHFDNVCHAAYFFPMQTGMPTTKGAGMSRTVICSGDEPVEGDDYTYHIVPQHFKAGASHTRYFYMAAHSATGFEQATKLHLFYDTKIMEGNGNSRNSILIALCNVHPDQAAGVTNGYSLSRNTRYHFTIRIQSRTAPQSDESPLPADSRASVDPRGSHPYDSPSVEYGPLPGDITVYLP